MAQAEFQRQNSGVRSTSSATVNNKIYSLRFSAGDADIKLLDIHNGSEA